MLKTDVEKVEALAAMYNGSGLNIAAFQIAIQLAKLNENIEKLRQTIATGNSLRAGDGYPER
jgi:hypothetical protein